MVEKKHDHARLISVSPINLVKDEELDVWLELCNSVEIITINPVNVNPDTYAPPFYHMLFIYLHAVWQS
ncbi:MAG: hypothetical protein ACRCX7_03155, partial [Cetobacterium sp.]|uniref:hypothetical protein n=1 Tax=Cetobacterium sp. TaxID=2071632 RepID=UPI003F36BBD1